MGGRMSDLEAKIKITVENGTAAGFNQAANSAESASKTIENAINNVKARLKTHFDDMQKSMEQAFHVNPSTFKNLGDAQEGMFNKISSSARKVYEETRTPMEQFKAKLAEVNQLLNLGAIDVETYGRKVEQLNSELEQTDGKASAAAGGLGKIGTLLAGLASVGFAKSILDTADAMQLINSQVRMVTSSETEYLSVQRQLLDVANNTGASLESTASLYVSTSRALKDYGYTQQEILQFTEATNNAMTIGNVGAQQQAAALMQLSQALGSGVLQGDEFKSIADAAPILLDTIAEYMGKSRTEIKKLGSEGQLTADVIFKAISGASEKLGKQAAKIPMTMGKALTVFSNNWQSMVSKLMNDSGTMSGIASIIKLIADNLTLVVPIVAGFAVAVAAATAQVIGLNVAMLANPFGIIAVSIGTVIGLIARFGDEIDVFGGGWSNLSDVVQAVWQVITETIGDAVDTVKSWFGDLTAWVDEEVGGWSSLFERVMGVISSTIGAYINVYINTFATGWMLIKEAANNMPQFFANLGKAIVNVFISAIEWMVNKAIGMINSMIDFANKAASMVGISGIEKLNNVKIGRMDDGGMGKRIGDSMTQDRVGAMVNNIKERAANIHEDKAMKGAGGGGGSTKTHAPTGGGGGTGRKGGGRKGGGKGHAGGSGAAQDPMQDWEEEIKAQKLAHREMQRETLTHQEWDLAREAAYWREKLATVDAGSKTGLKLREKILTLEDQLSKQSTEAKMNQVAEWEKLDKHKLEMEKDAADQALADGRISQLERLDLEIEFENRRYQIAYDALQERIALAEQDPTYSQTAIDKLKAQMAELGQGHERTQAKNEGKRENQRRKDAPNIMEMLQDGGKNVWQEAQQQMGQAFTAMLTRAKSFRQAMNGVFSFMRQTFVQEMVSKPLAALMGRFAKEGAMWLANGARQIATQSATSATVTGIKQTETTTNVGMNAIQAAAEAFKAMAGIPYVGPVLAVGAAAAAMAAVYGLMSGMGGGGSSTSTTTTRIPSAAGGWDIPAGINPLTQLHENEMVLPAEHAQTIREMAGQSGGDDSTIIINSTGGDFIHKKDLAKLLKQMKRDFKFT
ncbi:Minor tail protein Gp26 [Neisseria flavescens]|uniref:Putative phage tail tape measure protein, TP901 family n=2 Tax=Neisseria flavescens TaxID=484 RepID=C0EN37_NEIFL|nr:putative phage tail tape measure protein, TP901 family [Neisseria flavescens NRL30031/H210]SPY04745.1 Minor tail protein Gp26 [Neisseria meningitidis]SPY10449.1 Minor tail protein Gp26 [Neisseria meningitidis]STZ64958.1 Minor tail protein Gp26 [Neisseria flavescens]